MTARIINSIPSDRKRAVQVEDLLPAEFRGPQKTKEQIIEELAEKQKRFEAAHERRKKMKLLVGNKKA